MVARHNVGVAAMVWRSCAFSLLGAFALAFLWTPPAHASEARDLEQTIQDLHSLADAKEKLDRHGAARVELAEIRTWLRAATNAVKEEAEKAARRHLDLVRAQVRLIDRIISLSKLEHEAKRLDHEIESTKKRIEGLTAELEEKRVKLRAMKLRETGR